MIWAKTCQRTMPKLVTSFSLIGTGRAHFSLSVLYREEDPKKAVEHLQHAAKLGVPEALQIFEAAGVSP